MVNRTGAVSGRGSETRRCRRGPARTDRAGFSLLEALVALTLGAIVLGLVTSVFVAQNRFYGESMVRSEAQDHVRNVTEIVSQEFRNTSRGGVVTAETDRLVIRAPLSVGLVCGLAVGKGKGKSGASFTGAAEVYFPLDGDTVEGSRVSGYAVRQADGRWTYYSSSWAALSPSPVNANVCTPVGGQAGAPAGNHIGLSGGVENNVEEGGVVGLYEEVEFSIAPSQLSPQTAGLFRRRVGGTPVEIATGVDDEAGFQYRTAAGQLLDQVTGAGNLTNIVGIRLSAVANTEGKGGRPGSNTFQFGWVVDVPLRNAF